MPFPGGTYTGELVGRIRDEFENLYAQFEGWFRREHKHDGGHTNVTAQSLTVTASDAAGATGNVTADGDGTFDGNVTADADGNLVIIGELPSSGAIRASNGIDMRSSTTSRWSCGSFDSASNQRELLWIDRLETSGPYTFRVKRTGSLTYVLHPESAVTMNLGANAPGERFDEVNCNILRATVAIYERFRTVAMGEWIAVAHAAGNFTANLGTWGVDVADQLTFAYTLIGKTMIVAFTIASTDVSAAATQLSIAIPGGFTAARRMDTQCSIVDAGATAVQGQVFVSAGGTTINIVKNGSAAFTVTAGDNTNVTGTIVFEVS